MKSTISLAPSAIGFYRIRETSATNCSSMPKHYFVVVCTLRAIKVNFIYGILVSSGKCTAVAENASVSNEREFQKRHFHSK